MNILLKNLLVFLIAISVAVIGVGVFSSFYPEVSGLSLTLISINVFILAYIIAKMIHKEIELYNVEKSVIENTRITKDIKSDMDNLLKRYSLDLSDVASKSEAQQYIVAEMRYMNELLSQLGECFEGETEEELTQIYMDDPEEGDSAYTKAEILKALRDAIREQNVEMLLQPIVSLPQRKHRHYECFSQIRTFDDKVISPGAFMQVAKDNQLMSIIDHTLVLRCVQILRKALAEDHKVSFFCNFSFDSLENQKMLECVNDFFKSNPIAAQSIIFEFDFNSLQNKLNESMDRLKSLHKKGWVFSVDQFSCIDELNIRELSECGVRYLKADTGVVLGVVEKNPDNMKKFEDECKKYGIDLILSKVENEDDLRTLLDYGFDYGQGYLFSAPVVSKY